MLGVAQLLQSGFLAASCTILFINAIPSLSSRFANYGLRTLPPNAQSETEKPAEKRSKEASSTTHLLKLLDKAASVQLPHGSFAHFYIASVISSLFWGFQILSHASLLHRICETAESRNGTSKSMSMDQIALTWSLLLLQGTRRLAESYAITKFSASRMWFVHWYLGVTFYLAIGVAVWIEGTGTLLHTTSSWSAISFAAPSLRTLLGIPLFLLASGAQHDCHAYLASLPKYTLPAHPLFQAVVCPHYAAECVIYASLALIAAPPGAWVNRTLFCAFLFVVVNLGVTAESTREWYITKFGGEKVKGRWRMLPGVW